VDQGHPAHLVNDLVDQLDLSALEARYGNLGQPAYHPRLMLKVILYGFTVGVFSSRKLQRACQENLAFKYLAGMETPAFRTFIEFRQRHQEDMPEVFVQTVRLARALGLARLGTVALDGSKVDADTSKHKAMSYGRMVQAEAPLAAEVAGWLAAAEAADAADDAALGPDRRGDELPAWVADKAARLAKIREAKAALEAAARAEVEAEDAPPAAGPAPQPRRGRPQTPPSTPADQAQRNFTDPDSRIIKTKDGFIQGYNAQAAVDDEAQIIVAHGLTNGSDQDQLTPLLDALRAHTGRAPKELSADAGYCSEANLEALAGRGVRAYVATGRQRHGQAAATGRGRQQGPRVRAMRTRLRRGGFRSRYRLRKQIVEPVFGQIKHARGFRQFLLRGLAKVEHEWALVCTAHNLLKLAPTLA